MGASLLALAKSIYYVKTESSTRCCDWPWSVLKIFHQSLTNLSFYITLIIFFGFQTAKFERSLRHLSAVVKMLLFLSAEPHVFIFVSLLYVLDLVLSSLELKEAEGTRACILKERALWPQKRVTMEIRRRRCKQTSQRSIWCGKVLVHGVIQLYLQARRFVYSYNRLVLWLVLLPILRRKVVDSLKVSEINL